MLPMLLPMPMISLVGDSGLLAAWPPPITEKLMLTPCRGPVLLHLRP